jgi:histidinol-phosphate phosphatase family protein
MSPADRCILLDRDGVITVISPEGIKKPEDVQVLPFVPEALYELTKRGIQTFVIVHEPLIADGKMTREDLDAVHKRLRDILREHDTDVGEFAVATLPDGPATPAAKVKAGLLRKVGREHSLNLADSFYVGDEEADLQAAKEAGCKCCIVQSRRGFRTLRRLATTGATPDLVTRDLFSAVTKILATYPNP